ncbi:hypothetical protein Tco_0503311 [Tanacetum coccineum]
MSKDQSIPRRNKVDWHMANDYPILTQMDSSPNHESVKKSGDSKTKVCTAITREKTDQAPKASPGKRLKVIAKVAKSGKKKLPAQGLETLSKMISSKDDEDNADDEDDDQDDDNKQTEFGTMMESARDVYSKHRILAVTQLKIVEWHNYKHLDWITIRRNDNKLYTFKEGDYNRLRLQDIEDMLLLLVQGKLTNLNVEERRRWALSHANVLLRRCPQKALWKISIRCQILPKEDQPLKGSGYIQIRSKLRKRNPYTPYKDPQGFIYVNDHKRNRHNQKYQHGVLAEEKMDQFGKEKSLFHDQGHQQAAKGKEDDEEFGKFVGGRLYGTDLRLLQRTI